MPYRPRELVVRAREAAALLLASLDRNEMVQRFLDMYAVEHRRPGRADQPAHYREQLETIRRESILAMVLRVEAALPTRLKVSVPVRDSTRRKKRRGGKQKKAGKRRRARKPSLELAIPLLDLFREEFFVALGQWLHWSDADANEFWHDLELYENLSGRQPARAGLPAAAGQPRRPPSRATGANASGPFVDRTALLLDPSLMEQARRAAAKFQVELNGAADRVLRRVFSRRREN
jgi:hypothetical protein